MNRKGQKYGLTTTTGLGVTLFGAKSCTVHRFKGLEDGRHQDAESLHLIQTDERFQRAKNNILQTETLFIDEVSMLSARLLRQIECVQRSKKQQQILWRNANNSVWFFFQLQPVKNELYGDLGHPCYHVDWFGEAFPHKIHLLLISRQNDNSIKAVNELEHGEPSDDTVALIHSLRRPLSEDWLG